ncbi:unnamed protein product [Mytilus edulis]|uniref:Reverse transcriptase domain-containing protein n=1 Tax=Mytilus edulis TaxID=6550 RepID=A0A8S3R7P8_MYTED|nr:unnamed protein product [Mytilus edulis]
METSAGMQPMTSDKTALIKPEISVDWTEEAPPPIEIEMGPITHDEIKAAIKKLKNNKAPGVDGIPAEVLKSDINLNVNILRDLLNEIWEKEILPTQWKDGIIIKLQKKGNLTDCNNWRGITLLSVPGKILCRIILERIKDKIDSILREEQSGFRTNCACIDTHTEKYYRGGTRMDIIYIYKSHP